MSAALPRNLATVALSLSLVPSSGCGRAIRQPPQSPSPDRKLITLPISPKKVVVLEKVAG